MRALVPRRRWGRRILALVAGAVLAAAPVVGEAASLSLIRDAEIENTIRSYAAPLFTAAGLDPEAVDVHLVRDSSLNAFVAGGQRIFIFTGLLLAAETPGQVIGVIAHETGHIAGGHLAIAQDALRRANTQAILSMLLGAAAVVGGGGRAGAAVVAGGQQVAQRAFLQYTRTQESAADQAAMRFLNAAGLPPQGLLEFLEKISGQEVLLPQNQDPYVLTHPLARERVEALREQVAASPAAGAKLPPSFDVAFERMKAKLRGFLDPPDRTFRAYPASDTSLVADYARAIAYHQAANFAKATQAAEKLVAENPDDPYFQELLGQILFESGKIQEAIPPFERSVALAPHEPLLRVGLARAQISTDDPALMRAAIPNLIDAVTRDRDIPIAWHQLAVAYGRDGQMGQSSLASAEYNLQIGRRIDARFHAERALRLLPQGSPGWLRAQDIENASRPPGK